MRDLVLSLLLIGAIPFALARPIIASVVYVIISIGSIHKLTWGFAYNAPWALLYSGVLIISVLFSKEASIKLGLSRYVSFLPFLFVIVASTLVNHQQQFSLDRFVYIIKTQIGLILILSTIRNRSDVKWLVGAMVFSISLHALKSLFFVLSNTNSKGVAGPAESMIADNNHFATALVMCIPIIFYFFYTQKSKYIRIIFLFLLFTCVVVTLGTFSRGGLLALIAMAVLTALHLGKKRIQLGAILIFVAFAASSFMPDHFFNRMETIDDYKQDSSALGRIHSWQGAYSLARSEFFGGGLDNYVDGARYLKHAPEGSVPRAAHSIYFQLLGDLGFPGLFCFLWIACRAAYRSHRESKSAIYADQAINLPRVLLISLFGVLVGGIFLSLAYWEAIHFLLAFMIAYPSLKSPSSPELKEESKSPSRRHEYNAS